MRFGKLLRGSVVALACLGIVCPQPVMAASANPSNHVPVSLELEHVTLQDDGSLQGALVDTNGKPLADHPVAIAQAGKILVTAKTNQDGRFAIQGLQDGVYQIASAGKAANYRVYASDAPTVAKQGVIHVMSPEVARANLGLFGNNGGHLGGMVGGMNNTALIAAAAIAIGAGIAIAVDDENS